MTAFVNSREATRANGVMTRIPSLRGAEIGRPPRLIRGAFIAYVMLAAPALAVLLPDFEETAYGVPVLRDSVGKKLADGDCFANDWKAANFTSGSVRRRVQLSPR
jgi:hypothetical protein